MNLSQWLLSGYLALPLLALLACAASRGIKLAVRCGEALAVTRVLILAAIFRAPGGLDTQLSLPVIETLNVSAIFRVSEERLLFLVVAELIWLFCHLVGLARDGHLKTIRALAILLQGIIPILLLSGNLFILATSLLMGVVVLFFLLRFVGAEESIEDGTKLASRAFMMQALVCVGFLGWVLGQLGFSGASVIAGSFVPIETKGNVFTWIGIVLFCLWLPIGPWARWYSRLLDVFPESVSLVVTLILSGVAFRLVEISSTVYPKAQPEHYLLCYFYGYGMALLLFSELFSRTTKRSMLAEMPKLMFSMIPMMVGISAGRDLSTPLVMSVFIPAFTMIALVASVVRGGSQVSRLFVFLFLYLVYGMPGSPIFLLFGYLGSQSAATGAPWIVAFGLLWFLYFFTTVHLARRMFVDERLAETGGGPFLSGASAMVMWFAMAMGVVSSVVVWVFGVNQ